MADMSVDRYEEPGGDMGAAVRLAQKLQARIDGGDNGGGEYAGITGDGLMTDAAYRKFLAANAPTQPEVPTHIRAEAWRLAGQVQSDTLCQRIQNADIIAQWLHFGRVPQA
jgi:hypothetical protein